MTIESQPPKFSPLPPLVLASWSSIPPALASDCMNRTGSMVAAIKPLSAGMRLCGQARTVSTAPGDNSSIHAALLSVRPGEVLAIDGGATVDIAMWGANMTRMAMIKQVSGVVIDGSVRDSAEIRAARFACFCRNAVPRGPRKGSAGEIDAVALIGGLRVAPGDIVLGDDDGVVVVPLSDAESVLRAAREVLNRE